MNATSDLAMILLRKGMDAMSARQTAIANNVANIETPNYKSVDVKFEASLRTAIEAGANVRMAQTNEAHLNQAGQRRQQLDELEPGLYRRNSTAMRKDGNNVDVEKEMTLLAETALRFETMSTLASKKLELMRMVARETR